MISKRVLVIAVGLLLAVSANAMGAVGDVGNFNVNTLTINATDQLYVANWGIVQLQAGNAPVVYDGVRQYIQSGYSNAAWNGYGLVNHAAYAEGTAGTNNQFYALAPITASDYAALPGAPTTFHGVSVASLPTTATLLQFTYEGDSNIDGAVSPGDYTSIDSAIATQNSGGAIVSSWRNGDFNFDGAISPADYTLIDRMVAYQNSNGTLPALSSFPTAAAAAAAVPEPSVFVLGILALVSFLGYRKIRA